MGTLINSSIKITSVKSQESYVISQQNIDVLFYNIASSKINIEVQSSCNIYFLANGLSSEHDVEINIVNKKAQVQVYAISLVNKDHIQKTEISINHHAPETSCNYKFIGFAIDDSKLAIKAKNKIFKTMSGSSTHQLLKILTDNKASATAEPGLMIDDFDVVASHGNSIGQIDQRAIYYLESKGISREVARWMIIEGSITAILESVDKDIKNEFIESLKKHLGVSHE